MPRNRIYPKGLSHPFFGKHHTNESRRRMRLAVKKQLARNGGHSWNFGQRLTDEHRQNLSLAHKGKILSKEHRANIGLSQIGKISPMKGKCHSEETKKLMSQNNAKTLLGQFGDKHPAFGRHHTDEEKTKMSYANLGLNRGKKLSDEHKNKIRQGVINALKSGRYSFKPNKVEKSFDLFFRENSLPYKFVGDGSVWIEGMNPDFINVNGSKDVIEIFGCYWHGCPIHYKSNGAVRDDSYERIKRYAQYGFHCYVIWEHELRNIDKLQKINRTLREDIIKQEVK